MLQPSDNAQTVCWLAYFLTPLVIGSFMVGATAYASARAPTPGQTIMKDALSRFSAGSNHNCHVANDGTVRCWGSNSNGQLGDGTTTLRRVPVSVAPVADPTIKFTGVIAVASGNLHSCALKSDGTVHCWGSNSSGQLGDGTTTQRLGAVQVPGIGNAVRIAAGSAHTCAILADGTGRCWGSNGSGQLGDNSFTNRPNPVPVVGLTGAVAIIAGNTHTCTLLAIGIVRCWGANNLGQLGDGTTTFHATPRNVSDIRNAVAIASGRSHNCALLANGTGFCWGLNNTGQLGDGSITTALRPVPVSGLSSAASIAAADNHTCATLADGTARCWGLNSSGQLGDGSTNQQLTPIHVNSSPDNPLADIVAIDTGTGHTCALLSDGASRCWGNNISGQLGNDSTAFTSTTPVTVLGVTGSVNGKAIAAAGHICVVRAASTVSCWGRNFEGAVGDNSTNQRESPVAVVTASNTPLFRVVAVATGGSHSCALIVDGTVRCWGANTEGQLGDNSTDQRLTPVTVITDASNTPLSNVTAITTGSVHTCALISDGTAKCWGNNSNRQLGDNSVNTNRFMPVTVVDASNAPLSNIVAIGAGTSHTCAVIADGTIRCWGDNSDFQLGDGSNINRPTPVTVRESSGRPVANAVAIAVGMLHTCALIADGTAKCWGQNDGQELGVISPPPLTPVTITTAPNNPLTNAVGITTVFYHACVLLADGTARCWGNNFSGELGNGTFDDQFPPTTVISGANTPLSNITSITAGGNSTCALRVNGAVFCWGRDNFGQIGTGAGDGITPLPVEVPSFTLNIDPRVELHDGQREAIVNIIAVCEAGDRLRVRMQLTQNSVSGRGHDQFECTGTLTKFPVKVRTERQNIFVAGPAHAKAEAVILGEGGEREEQEWARSVQIVLP